VVVQFFHTCLVTEVDPEADLAAASILERLGWQVEILDATEGAP
jgi:hypothetical protein